MTDTGQVPGEGLPENAGMVDQQGVPTPGAYTYLSETTAEDEDLLLLPGAQSAWGNEVAPPAPEPVVETVHEPGPHEMAGRDSGSVDLSAVRLPNPSAPPAAPRRPLHLGPPLPDTSASPVRSLADRGPAGAPVRHPGTPTSGPEYLDAQHLREMPPQGAAPWGAQAPVEAPVAAGATPAETVVPAARQQTEQSHAAQAVMTRPDTDTGTDTVADTGAPQPEDPARTPLTPEAAEPAYAGEGADATGPAVPAEPANAVPGPGPEPVPQVAEAVREAAAPDAPHAPDTDAIPAEDVPVPAVEAAEVPPAEVPVEMPVEVPVEVPSPEAVQAPETPLPDATPETIPEARAVEVTQPSELQTAAVPVMSVTPEAAAEPEPAQAPESDVPPAAPQTVPDPSQAPVMAPTSEAPAAPEAGAPEQEAGTPEQEAGAPDPEAAAQAPAPAPVVPAPAPEVIEPAQAHPAAEAPAPAPAPEPEAPAAVPADLQPDSRSDDQPHPQPEPEQPSPEQPAPEAPVAEVPVAETPVAEMPAAQAPGPEPAPVEPPAEPAPSAQLHEPEPVPAPVPVPDPDAAPAPVAAAEVHPLQPAPEVHPLQPAPDPHPVPVLVPQHQDPPQDPAHITDPASQIPDASAPAPVTGEAGEPASAAIAPTEVLAATAPQFSEPVVPAAPLEPQPHQTLGQFVPVDGMVPTTPHLAPTPPHPLVLPADEPLTPEAAPEAPAAQAPGPEAAAPSEATPVAQPLAAPAADIPAPREADPAAPQAEAEPEPEPEPEQPDPNVAQNPEDLATRAADQEEGTAAVEEVRESTGPAAPAYADAEREAVLKVMRERRDIRNGFRSDPIPHEVLLRVLEAAHTAPSVGHSQPWDFVVIRSADTRRAMHELATRQRDAYAKSLPKGRAKQFKELKIEAILDTPVNIVVTADPTRGGRHTLGRHTQPQMAPYSSALAVENLWLAARAEGLGVGWVSFFDEREMVRALGLPEHLDVVAYLCVGYVDEFPDEPELMQAGWAKRRPLSWVVHEETYGRRALPGEDPHDLLAETVAGIRPLDAKALGEAWERQKRMTKPAGALGMLEIISAQLSGLSRQCPPPIPEPAAVAIFAGDHGVHAQGVTPWPQEVTAQMVANFLGGGAVCNAFANQVGAEVCVVDVGVVSDLPATPGLLPRKIRAGTSDMTTGPAMSREEAKQAIEVGIETARDLVAAGNKALLTGEMGIANTTASAALISVFTGADPAEVTGRGTGINDETLARKTEVVRRALEVHQPDPADPIGVLAAVGGFEHAAMVGLLLGGASLRTPVILDGVSAGAAALVARAIAPEVLAACIAGHRSAEPGHVAALNKLGLRPLVDLDLRLGEGTGALLALPLVQSTARAMHEVATFDSAGVTEK
ncbi:nicotinate-nucleotide--dimethylbenzimidazole phosphoribosyltransferase [Streptomyces bobili]|uniref:nicotinate-nucleotide--dimethylbenzimidazole phosphoribosyltransferase n=1 Tax=Streptomyces bobili TaxID=67280 RepID=UPI0022551D0D|nr:nicotinate-nucleotide--dimethylbenzimidazole phosphoribosyltransferase [Streptomyces bobili]MCX5522899.1 nicotinate-nucleotide--dimethylbenzimidazole phosphoribosyltransferase [Streptomyces bobili]